MLEISQRSRVDRGRRAEEVLRHEVMHEAAKELNQRAFNDFLSADLSSVGEDRRERALRMVHGAEAYLAILHEWVVEGRELEQELELSENNHV